MVVVTELYVYPLKSGRAISVSSAALCMTGFRWDRHWMVVNEKGRALTMRVEPKIAQIVPFLPPEYFTESLPSNASLSLRAPGMDELRVPLFGNDDCKEKVEVVVWGWTGVAVDEGFAAADWFSKYLGRPCRLVRHSEGVTSRPTDEKYASGYQASFTDEFPFLLASQVSLAFRPFPSPRLFQESIDFLNGHMQEQLPIIRFRPNIVVKGCNAFAEDSWKSFKIGDLAFHGVKMCSRCKVPTVNPETAEFEVEPTPTLQAFRRGELLSELSSVKKQVFFGQNAVCKSFLEKSTDELVIRVGDELQVSEVFEKLCF